MMRTIKQTHDYLRATEAYELALLRCDKASAELKQSSQANDYARSYYPPASERVLILSQKRYDQAYIEMEEALRVRQEMCDKLETLTQGMEKNGNVRL